MRNLIVCCDGTGNVWRQSGASNVVKLARQLDLAADNGQVDQVLYYDPGVGTAEGKIAESRTLRTRLAKLAGLAWGNGAWTNVAEAYIWLMRHYRPGDRLFLFGFSRGAFTIRAVAGMLNWFRLLKPEHESLLPTLINVYRMNNDPTRSAIAHDMRIRFARALDAGELEQVRSCRDADQTPDASIEDDIGFPIHLIGVFDTVESVGLGELLFGSINSDNRVKPGVRFVRHALAIDETRWPYEPRQYAGANGRGERLLQVWFAGVHSDVGGGYGDSSDNRKADPETGLSDITLWWMLEESQSLGLRLKPDWQATLNPDPCGLAHNETLATPPWAVVGNVRRPYHCLYDKTPALRLLCHESVQVRLAQSGNTYRPPETSTVVEVMPFSDSLRARCDALAQLPDRAPAATKPTDGVWHLSLIVIFGALALGLLCWPGAESLAVLQITEWLALPQALLDWQGPYRVGALLWLDSVAVVCYFSVLILLSTWLGHWARNERRPSMFACYSFGALALSDLLENLGTALCVAIADEPSLIGLPAMPIAKGLALLVGVLAYIKFVAAVASMVALGWLGWHALRARLRSVPSSWWVKGVGG